MRRDSWTDEEIERFFTYRNNHNPQYWSEANGQKVLKLVAPHLSNVKNVLDYGCGLGFMTGYLIEAGYNTTAMDFTHSSVEAVNNKFTGRKNFNGCFYYPELVQSVTGGGGIKNLPKFDAIFILEVIEHLSDFYLDELIKNLKIFCKKDGYVIITTPNNEDLEANMMYCPFCDSEFNNSQHLRTWTAESLSKFLQANNFETAFITEVTISNLYQHLRWDYKLRNILAKIWRKLHGIKEPNQKLNLICAAKYKG